MERAGCEGNLWVGERKGEIPNGRIFLIKKKAKIFNFESNLKNYAVNTDVAVFIQPNGEYNIIQSSLQKG